MANYTQAAILDTFGEMLENMAFDKITVSGLVRACDISRNTFYYHYQDIYALLDAWLVQELGKFDDAAEQWQDKAKALLYACREHRKRVYHIFNSISRDRIERYIFDSAERLAGAHVRRQAEGSGVSAARVRAVSDICRYTVFGFFLRFLWNDMTDDVEGAVDELDRLIREILTGTLHGKE